MGRRHAKSPIMSATASASGSTDAFLQRLVAEDVLIGEPDDVRNYLLRYPELTSVVAAASVLARDTFGRAAELSLEVYRDPEIDDQYLTLLVRLQRYDEGIAERLEQVQDSINPELARASGWFIVTTDFRPPLGRKHGV